MQPSSPPLNLLRRFLEQATSHPQRVALVTQEQCHSYAELLTAASRLAALTTLAEEAITPAVEASRGQLPRFIAALGNRTFEQYVASVAAPLSGRTFLPMFSGDPPSRHARVLERTRARILLVDPTGMRLLPDILPHLVHPLCIVAPTITRPDFQMPAHHRFYGAPDFGLAAPDVFAAGAVPCEPDRPAYMLFTSGSTGSPKAVVLTHRNLGSFLESALFRLAPCATDRFAQISNLTWDVGFLETHVAWAVGAAVYRLPEQIARIGQFVREHALTHWFSTPSTGFALVDLRQLRPGALPSLRCSVFAGEALPNKLLDVWQQAAPGGIIENFYGPTEASVTVACHRWRGPSADRPFCPFGEPFPGQRLVIRNAAGEPLPDGDVGEVHLSGDQIVEGYWEDPERTAERFVRDADGTLWYRTGDLAQHTDQGWLFRGRVDDQLKVQGYRIERQEVEGLLRDAAQSQAVAVLALPLRKDGATLCLHGVVAESARTSAEIHQHCRRNMPAHMVPVAIHIRPLPRTPSGKVDYGRLRDQLLQTGQPPRDAVAEVPGVWELGT